jgi:hypothetical protein
MSSLPSISHHLFVAAVGQDDRSVGKPLRQGSQSGPLEDPSQELPLEMLEAGQPLPAGVARPLRTSGMSGRR